MQLFRQLCCKKSVSCGGLVEKEKKTENQHRVSKQELEFYKDLTEKEKSELIGAPASKSPTRKQKKLFRNLENEYGSFWMSSVEKGHGVVETVITKYKFHPNCTLFTSDGYSPLYYGVLRHDIQYVQFLLAHGADANELTGPGKIPILACSNDYEISQLLLKYGARKSFKEHSGKILVRVVESHNAKLIPLYVKYGANPNAYDLRGFTPLLAYVRGLYLSQDITKIKLLIQAGALLSLKVKAGKYIGRTLPQHLLIKIQKAREECKKISREHKKIIEELGIQCAAEIFLETFENLRTAAIHAQKQRREPFDLVSDYYLGLNGLRRTSIQIVQQYSYEEPDYEVLEKVPLPKIEETVD